MTITLKMNITGVMCGYTVKRETSYIDVGAYFSFEQIEEIDMAFEVSARTYEPERYKAMCYVKSLNLYKGWCAYCSCFVCRLCCLKKMIGDVKYG